MEVAVEAEAALACATHALDLGLVRHVHARLGRASVALPRVVWGGQSMVRRVCRLHTEGWTHAVGQSASHSVNRHREIDIDHYRNTSQCVIKNY